MALLSPQFLREHPVRSGLVWAAGFAPLMAALMLLTGGEVTPLWVAKLCGAAIAGGLIWGFAMRAIQKGRAE